MPRKKKQNDLTSPELLAQVNEDNTRLLSDFCQYLRSIKRSQQTIAGYKNDIEIFFCWNLQYNHNKEFTTVKKRDFVAFQTFLMDKNQNSPSRVRRIKASLSSMSNYIANVLDDEYVGYIPTISKVQSPDLAPVYEKTVLTPDDVQYVLQTLVQRKQFQKACAFALAISCRARKSELARFKTSFFAEENIIYGSLYKTPPIRTKGRSGGKYISKYVLTSIFKPYFELWMAEREQLGIDSEWLFVTKHSDAWVQAGVYTFDSWADTISNLLDCDFYWHCARHYWTSYLLRAGIPNDVVTDLSGWQSVNMVATYDDRDKDESFAKYFRDGHIVAAQSKHLDEL